MTPAISIEVEVFLSGDVAPYRAATRWDPAEGGEVEDLDIEDLRVGYLPSSSILDGVDTKSPAIQRLFSNILEAHRREAEQAIVDDQLSRAA